jgi:hypothetical protein
MTLDDAIATLYARKINCGCETFWDGGIKVRIADIMNGHHSEPIFSRENMGMAGHGSSTRTALSQGVPVAPTALV